MKEKFTTLTSTCAPLPVENVDTDQIIPARFLKSTSREGFGDHLFNDGASSLRASLTPDFILNRPEAKGARVLVAGKTSAADRRANMPRGLLPTTVSAP